MCIVKNLGWMFRLKRSWVKTFEKYIGFIQKEVWRQFTIPKWTEWFSDKGWSLLVMLFSICCLKISMKCPLSSYTQGDVSCQVWAWSFVWSKHVFLTMPFFHEWNTRTHLEKWMIFLLSLDLSKFGSKLLLTYLHMHSGNLWRMVYSWNSAWDKVILKSVVHFSCLFVCLF